MKQLFEEHLQTVLDYLMKEPEFNLFIIGDLEIYGMEAESVSCYTADSWMGGIFPYFILNYRSNFIVHSHDCDYPKEEVAQFLAQFQMRNLSGKLELIEPLIPLLKGLLVVPTYMARLDTVNGIADSCLPLKKMVPADVPAIYDMLIQIEEFFTLADKPREDALADILESITHGGRMYGIYEGDCLVSIAGTSAENSMSAMVVSVATLPAFRGRGYASGLVSALCHDCLNSGMQFLCLFYDNPEAGTIYRRLGFQEVGSYAMVRSI